MKGVVNLQKHHTLACIALGLFGPQNHVKDPHLLVFLRQKQGLMS